MSSHQHLRRPRALRPSGRVAVLSAASPSEPERIGTAADHLRARGFDVVLAGNLFERHRGYLSGDDDRRLAEINRFLCDPSFDAFLFSRGGYGAMRILDRIDYSAIRKDPRPIIGYSDVTALHQAVALHSGVTTFHGPMLNTDFFEALSPETDRWFWSALSGQAPLHHEFPPNCVLSPGRASGTLFGGCLSITVSLLGTPYDYWIDGGVWFWEDVTEPVYRIDRMLTTLRLSGRLAPLRGVLIGKLRECGVGEDRELEELLLEFFGDSGIPVVRDLPFGHFGDNLVLPIGQPVTLDTASCSLSFEQPFVD